MKRVLLLIATNIAVMLVLSIVVSVLGLDRWLDGRTASTTLAALVCPPSSASAARSSRS